MSNQANTKTMTGKVVSDKMNKTVVIKVERRFAHPAFKKVVKTTKKYKVHDEKNECSEGDVIRIQETRPLSKEKRWRLLGIITKTKLAKKEKVVQS